MDVRELEIIIEHLEQRIDILLEQYTNAKERIAELEGLNKEQQSSIEKQKESLKNFQNKSKLNSFVGELAVAASSDDKEALKLKIDQYIKDIDRCIELLSE